MNQEKLKQPVYLCGMMGSGKSTIGKHLAEELNVSFHDVDTLIEEGEGMTIPEIFEKKQEEGFREIERKTLINLSRDANGVVALGGGSLQNQQIVDHLKLYGWLVFIDASKDEIVERLTGKTGRPMLGSPNPDEISKRIEALFAERMVYYDQAHFTIQTLGKPIEEITTEITKKLEIYEGRRNR